MSTHLSVSLSVCLSVWTCALAAWSPTSPSTSISGVWKHILVQKVSCVCLKSPLLCCRPILPIVGHRHMLRATMACQSQNVYTVRARFQIVFLVGPVPVFLVVVSLFDDVKFCLWMFWCRGISFGFTQCTGMAITCQVCDTCITCQVELATGEFPYKNCRNDFEMLAKILDEDPPLLPPSQRFSMDFCNFVCRWSVT